MKVESKGHLSRHQSMPAPWTTYTEWSKKGTFSAAAQTMSTHVSYMQGVPVQASIDACPVDCIQWSDREELPVVQDTGSVNALHFTRD